MTQDKELLLKDLCARLPYEVKVACNKNVYTVKGLDLIVTDEGDWEYAVTAKGIAPIEMDFIKPYLFPLSSMTEEQNDSWRDAWFPDLMTSTDVNYPESEKYLALSHVKSLEWLYKNHFDVNGLIEKGLAIDATGLNIY